MTNKHTVTDFREMCLALSKLESYDDMLASDNIQVLVNDVIELKGMDARLEEKLQHFASNLKQLDTAIEENAPDTDRVNALLNRVSTYAHEFYYHQDLLNMAREEISSAQSSVQQKVDNFDPDKERYGFNDEYRENDLKP